MLFNNIQTVVLILLSLALSILPIVNDYHSRLNQKLSFLMVNVCFWGLAVFLTRNAPNAEKAIFWASLFPLGVRLAAPAFLDFSLQMVNLKDRVWDKVKYAGYASGVIFAVIDSNKHFYKGAKRYSFGYYTQGGPLHILWFCTALLLLLASCYVMGNSYSRANNFIRHKLKYFLLAGVIFVAFECFNTLPMYGFDVYPMGTLGAILGLILIAYATVENKLVDINLLISESVITLAMGSLLIIVLYYVMLALHVSAKGELLPILLVAVPYMLLLSVFAAKNSSQFLNRQFIRIFPGQYKFRKTLAENAQLLIDNHENFDESIKLVLGSPGARVIPLDQPIARELQAHQAARHSAAQDFVLAGDLKSNSAIRKAMQDENIYMMIPLQIFSRGQFTVVGYLVLDRSMCDKVYTREDFEFLKLFAHTIALAYLFSRKTVEIKIENARMRRTCQEQARKAAKLETSFDNVIEYYEKIIDQNAAQIELLREELLNQVSRPASPAKVKTHS
jgi:hypothetical protein